MDESDGLENRYGGNLIVGSNPTPSARIDTSLARISIRWSGPFAAVRTERRPGERGTAR